MSLKDLRRVELSRKHSVEYRENHGALPRINLDVGSLAVLHYRLGVHVEAVVGFQFFALALATEDEDLSGANLNGSRRSPRCQRRNRDVQA